MDTTLAILAGGEGSRMGKPKGLLRIGGLPILRYLLRRLQWSGPTLLITAPGREHPPGWELFGGEVADPVGGLGPLRGMLTALEHARTPLVTVVTVDMPCVERGHLDWLANAIGRSGSLGVMSRRNEAPDSVIEPFPMVLRVEAASAVRSRVDRGRLSVHQLLEEPGFVALPAPASWGESVWTNLNRPSDVERFRERSLLEGD